MLAVPAIFYTKVLGLKYAAGFADDDIRAAATTPPDVPRRRTVALRRLPPPSRLLGEAKQRTPASLG